MKILEIKRHLNKADESYLCDLVRHGGGDVVLKYVSEQSGRVGDMTFEVGSTTYAYYKTGAGYVLWKMFGPNNKLKGHLFHICRDQQVEEDRVEYLDLLLDLWLDAGGHITILDRDEVEACAANGMVGEQDLAWIARQEQEIMENWRKIISDFDHLITPLLLHTNSP
jgi:predicted RNA-binding protein associated with RNAse of E/G family